MEDEWYTTVEVARLLGRSDRFVRDRVKTGELPAVAKQNEKRASYKISREALMGFLLGSERKSVKEVAAVLKDADEGYLRELEEVIAVERKRRSSGPVQIFPKCQEIRAAMLDLEKRTYAQDLILFDWEKAYERAFRNPYHFSSVVYDTRTRRAEGYLSFHVTGAEFFEALCKGKTPDDCPTQWQRGQTPVLYLNSFILEDPAWAPFLFRDIARQLREVARREGMALRACFAIAADVKIRHLLCRYGFEEVGRYAKEFPVMLNRDITAGRMGAYLR